MPGRDGVSPAYASLNRMVAGGLGQVYVWSVQDRQFLPDDGRKLLFYHARQLSPLFRVPESVTECVSLSGHSLEVRCQLGGDLRQVPSTVPLSHGLQAPPHLL